MRGSPRKHQFGLRPFGSMPESIQRTSLMVRWTTKARSISPSLRRLSSVERVERPIRDPAVARASARRETPPRNRGEKGGLLGQPGS